MKVFHYLTALLFLLKALGAINISWLLVFTPSIIRVAIGLVVIVVALVIAIIAAIAENK